MTFQAPITIAQAIEEIHQRRYLLPGIQREFVWNAGRIEELFDSVMRGYPIGSFLYWRVDSEHASQYQFYDFVRDYHERDRRHNEKASVAGQGAVTAILDGQQRLTSLYIGTHGSYATRAKYRGTYPERRLYLDLLEDDDGWDGGYRFRLLTKDEAEADPVKWYRVGDVLDVVELFDINRHLRARGLEDVEHANRALFKLFQTLRVNTTINYYLEESQDLDRVLNVFIRVNSGGEPLSYSDLLLSVAAAQWTGVEAKEEINAMVTELNQVGDGFRFDRDFVLKACLVLSDLPSVAFKVTNFTRENIARIEAEWRSIQVALRAAAETAASFGLNGSSLTSHNATIPIAYYLMRRGHSATYSRDRGFAEDRRVIRTWLLSTLLKGTFGAQGDTVLAMMRSEIANSAGGFPAAAINARLAAMFKAIRFAPEEIDSLLDTRYGQRQTAQVLALLYPGVDYWSHPHQDHLHPRSRLNVRELVSRGMEEDEAKWMVAHRDDIANLGILEGFENQQKSDRPLAEWLDEMDETSRQAAKRRHRIPEDVDVGIHGFRSFLEARRRLLRNDLENLLAWAPVEGAPEPAEAAVPVAVEFGAEPAEAEEPVAVELVPEPAEAVVPVAVESVATPRGAAELVELDDVLVTPDLRQALRVQVRQILEATAATRAIITYGALASRVNLDLEDPAARNALSEVLRDTSEEEIAAHRPMISCLVVQAESQVPGAGFFALGQLRGQVLPGEDPDEFAFRQMRATWEYWGSDAVGEG